MQKYLQSCETDFWKNVFRAELEYILQELIGTNDVLSVGCGPAIIEAGLAEHGFNVTGLDISEQALSQAPDSARAVAGSAENMFFRIPALTRLFILLLCSLLRIISKPLKKPPAFLKKKAEF